MIDEELARRFIEKLDKEFRYNINIINSKGIIIASRDPSRLGTFHEAAWRLIDKKEASETVQEEDEDLIGTRPGINLPIQYKDETIGVFGVTGNPAEIAELAFAMKTSFELMIELEMLKALEQSERDSKKQFYDALLNAEPYDEGLIDTLSAQLGFRQDLLRVPVLIAVNEPASPVEVMNAIRESRQLNDQDMILLTKDRNILIFRSIRLEKNGIIDGFRKTLGQFTDRIDRQIKKDIRYFQPAYYIGSPQGHLKSYRKAYLQTEWLGSHHNASVDKHGFFLDYVPQYFYSLIPGQEYYTAFQCIYDTLSLSQKSMVYSTVHSLLEANLSIKEAAMKSGVHRNTITARIDKIREMFGIDIINDPQGRNFMHLLVSFETFLVKPVHRAQ